MPSMPSMPSFKGMKSPSMPSLPSNVLAKGGIGGLAKKLSSSSISHDGDALVGGSVDFEVVVREQQGGEERAYATTLTKTMLAKPLSKALIGPLLSELGKQDRNACRFKICHVVGVGVDDEQLHAWAIYRLSVRKLLKAKAESEGGTLVEGDKFRVTVTLRSEEELQVMRSAREAAAKSLILSRKGAVFLIHGPEGEPLAAKVGPGWLKKTVRASLIQPFLQAYNEQGHVRQWVREDDLLGVTVRAYDAPAGRGTYFDTWEHRPFEQRCPSRPALDGPALTLPRHGAHRSCTVLVLRIRGGSWEEPSSPQSSSHEASMHGAGGPTHGFSPRPKAAAQGSYRLSAGDVQAEMASPEPSGANPFLAASPFSAEEAAATGRTPTRCAYLQAETFSPPGFAVSSNPFLSPGSVSYL
ncbi:hypothetical protein EMIHUDRAFT_440402 [Emiliania huxleyi CCMP1516]|uniref:Uncharacterized protein n=2 Tax=Emiliania huxleyi TaxID=2903 RepID=A0A0D3KNU1_EMIH1|nr:hypothetical protein EMIHUDRAFT_440402 [Emiliania huxleyi CCMP1516]EOD37426.1 hypothetical protein EMIHUDRAFT_440402 [Emiliania huxleyi CCMP1516]|eukprot:XP_005789855.1 hypothetical protein EMIHUDRAFT_440402 [Emiliania huxleyi CCMP1516]